MRRIQIARFREGQFDEVEDWVGEEGLVSVEIAPRGGFSAVMTPHQVREFVYGHLLSEGLIRVREDVLTYEEEVDAAVGFPGEAVRVVIRLREVPSSPPAKDLIWTACGDGTLPAPALPPLAPRPWVRPEALLALSALAAGEVEGFRLTGAYHYAFLFDPAPCLRHAAGDIGRHTAVDKVLGAELLGEGRFAERILLTTGRISADLVVKCLRAGIPVLASQGAALLGAIAVARRHRLGLIGFLRGKRFNVYSGREWFVGRGEPL